MYSIHEWPFLSVSSLHRMLSHSMIHTRQYKQNEHKGYLLFRLAALRHRSKAKVKFSSATLGTHKVDRWSQGNKHILYLICIWITCFKVTVKYCLSPNKVTTPNLILRCQWVSDFTLYNTHTCRWPTVLSDTHSGSWIVQQLLSVVSSDSVCWSLIQFGAILNRTSQTH